VPAKPPQIALKRTNNGIRRASTALIVPLLPTLALLDRHPEASLQPTVAERAATRTQAAHRGLLDEPKRQQ
jgi:hypothetical protein